MHRLSLPLIFAPVLLVHISVSQYFHSERAYLSHRPRRPCRYGPPLDCMWFQHCSDGVCRQARCRSSVDCAPNESCFSGKCYSKITLFRSRVPASNALRNYYGSSEYSRNRNVVSRGMSPVVPDARLSNSKSKTYRSGSLMSSKLLAFSRSRNQAVQSTPTKCPKNKLVDLVVLLDQSNSMGDTNFRKMKTFIKDTLASFDIDSGMTQVAIVPYSTTPATNAVTLLKDLKTAKQVQQALSNVSYRKGRTGTGLALHYVADRIFRLENGMRPSSKKVILLITDGITNTGPSPSEPGMRLAKRGVNIFGIGIKGASADELLSITRDRRKVFNLRDFDTLGSRVEVVRESICKNLK